VNSDRPRALGSRNNLQKQLKSQRVATTQFTKKLTSPVDADRLDSQLHCVQWLVLTGHRISSASRCHGAPFVDRRHFFSGALFILVCCISLATPAGRTYAACGDWLVHPSAADANSSGVGATVLAAERTDTSAKPPSQSCNGAYCRSAPKLPAVPVPAGFSVAGVKAALQVALVSLTFAASESRANWCAEARPAKGYPSRIDHPPRDLARILS
jgi:hypothetical protein